MCVCVNVVEDRYFHKHVDFQGYKKAVEGACHLKQYSHHSIVSL